MDAAFNVSTVTGIVYGQWEYTTSLTVGIYSLASKLVKICSREFKIREMVANHQLNADRVPAIPFGVDVTHTYRCNARPGSYLRR